MDEKKENKEKIMERTKYHHKSKLGKMIEKRTKNQ